MSSSTVRAGLAASVSWQSVDSGNDGLPASVAAEAAILAAILLNNSHYQEAAGRVEAADFSLDSHRRVFLRMGELLIWIT
jgi:hypothetical protein